MPAGTRHEHAARVVDPDLLDRRVVEVALQRPEARDPGHQLLDHRVLVTDREHGTGQAALVVVPDDPFREPPHEAGVPLRVDRLGPDGRAQLRVERLDQVTVRIGVRQAHGSPEVPRGACSAAGTGSFREYAFRTTHHGTPRQRICAQPATAEHGCDPWGVSVRR